MSAPGERHEQRARVLEACADLSGHCSPCRLSADDLPDLVRADVRSRRLFVGDAKNTESPGGKRTQARLFSYARALRPWLAGGFAVRLAVCHGRAAHDARWHALLRHALSCAGLEAGGSGSVDLGAGTIIAWIDVSPEPQDTAGGRARLLDDVGPAR